MQEWKLERVAWDRTTKHQQHAWRGSWNDPTVLLGALTDLLYITYPQDRQCHGHNRLFIESSDYLQKQTPLRRPQGPIHNKPDRRLASVSFPILSLGVGTAFAEVLRTVPLRSAVVDGKSVVS